MNRATKSVVSTFGTLAAVAGIEHGIGEILQGNAVPEGIVILSWPESAFFQVMAGEPAMTLVPNLLVSGILSVLLALIFLAWATLFVQQKHAGLVLLLLSIILLLVGGGFGPPLLGIIVGLIATRIHMPLTWWRAHLPVGLQRMLARLWPWSYSLCLISWLYLFPGTNLHDYVFEINNPELVVSVTILSAFGSLLLTILTGIAHDVQRQSVARRVLRIGD